MYDLVVTLASHPVLFICCSRTLRCHLVVHGRSAHPTVCYANHILPPSSYILVPSVIISACSSSLMYRNCLSVTIPSPPPHVLCLLLYPPFPRHTLSCYVRLLLISCCLYTLPPFITIWSTSPSCRAHHDSTRHLHAFHSLSVSVSFAIVLSKPQSTLFLDSLPYADFSVPTRLYLSCTRIRTHSIAPNSVSHVPYSVFRISHPLSRHLGSRIYRCSPSLVSHLDLVLCNITRCIQTYIRPALAK